MEYKTVTMKIAVLPADGNPVFGETTTWVELDDEAGGPFIKITQERADGKEGVVVNDMTEFQAIYDAAQKLLDGAKDWDK